MRLAPTPEQEALRDTARRFLRAEPPEPGRGAVPWQRLADLGWLDPGLGAVELVLLAEEAGAALLGGAWLSTVCLAAPAFRAAGRWPRHPATLAWAEPPGASTLGQAAAVAGCQAVPTPGGPRLTGVKVLVPVPAREVVVVAHDPDGVGLYLVDPAAGPAALAEMSTVDPTRPAAELVLDATPAERLVAPPQAAAVLRAIRWRTLATQAGEAVGVAQRALDIGVAHARTRVQFGRPVGAYQAVAHRLADGHTAVTHARSLAYRAAWCVDATPEHAAEAALTATLAARGAALAACEAAIQTLGATGFTWEHPLHRLYRRARWLAAFDGPPGSYRAELAALLVDAPAQLPDGPPPAGSAAYAHSAIPPSTWTT